MESLKPKGGRICKNVALKGAYLVLQFEQRGSSNQRSEQSCSLITRCFFIYCGRLQERKEKADFSPPNTVHDSQRRQVNPLLPRGDYSVYWILLRANNSIGNSQIGGG